MRKLLLVALGVAIGTAAAVVLSAREQLGAPAAPPPESVLPPDPSPSVPGTPAVPPANL